ncbi:sigma 54-interacting transcriptional regulator [Tepidanaerobacter sp. GT38]|uniref:sigma 54-interacting transcriptional regulator n=1 Tax=Tepidanaerobacter sp. GT38 TaxID=2722793 RepID=UPI00272AAF2B|nr:sigma 54-interacting transcriptional regulator [Tepidanaerobacter sp. GT38]MCG1012457.1 sigma 54-interacting transcriptional regulator [Tepidanaerobacter sp. GT38]
MLQKDAVFTHPKGMHIRAAAMVVNKAYEIKNMMGTSIYIRNQSGREVPATALMAIHSLNIKPGERITIVARGPNVNEAIDSFEELFRRDLLPQSNVELEQVDDILEENTIKADKIFDSIGLGLIVTNKAGAVILCNRIAEDLIGIKKHYILGSNIQDIIPGLDLTTGLSIGVSVFRSNDNTRQKLASADIKPIFVEGEITGYSIVFNRNTSTTEFFSDLSLNISPKKDLLFEQAKEFEFDEAFSNIIGRSEKFVEALNIAYKAANTSSTVLLQGESGTGKGLVAEAIHRASNRRKAPFIKVNCPGIPTNLIESELFGHERGAFTGAIYQKIGKFEMANGGTIFLDEIGELDKNLQAKLLRVLQDREFERVGGNQVLKTDVRIIAATHRNLKEMVDKEQFREDLYYRLNVVPITLPSLRERKDDIPLLVEYFLENLCKKLGKKQKTMTKRAIGYLYNYDWPGNVRELENIIERVINLADGDVIDVWDLPSHITGKGTEKKHSLINLDSNGELAPYEEYDKAIIKMALKKYKSFNAAGKALGITHKTVAAKARRYGLLK